MERSIQMAETFLVKYLKPTTDMETFDDLRLFEFTSNTLKMHFVERRDNLLVPEIVTLNLKACQTPCTCDKCVRKNKCCYKVGGIKCCKYCKCKGGNYCQNPIAE